MRLFAEKVVAQLGITLPPGTDLVDMSRTDRFCMYKAGPVLAVSVRRLHARRGLLRDRPAVRRTAR